MNLGPPNEHNIREDDEGNPWFWHEETAQWLPCTHVKMKDGSEEWLQATYEEVMSAVYPT